MKEAEQPLIEPDEEPYPEDYVFGEDEELEAGDAEDFGLVTDAMLQEAMRTGQAGGTGPREFFWGTLAPLSLLGALGVAGIVLFAALALFPDEAGAVLRYAGTAAAAAVLVYLPLNYYLVRTRLERPIQRLEYELRGYLPWRSEGEVLLQSLRRAVEQVRQAAYSAREELEEESGRLEEAHARLVELQLADRFADQAAEALRGKDRLDLMCATVADLVRSVWPADDVMLVRVEDQEVHVLHHESKGRRVEPDESGPDSAQGPLYRRNALPAPVKEALRRGFYAETGLPFSQDTAFPEARSFVAMSLEHRGAASGVLLAASSELTPPTAEPLRRARPLFSLAYSRSLYLLEKEEASVRDALTGAYTHNHFLSLVRHEVARSNRYSRPISCLMVDIDRLRRINERYGPGHGDMVIAEVSALVQGSIRSTDALARVSGGTFAVLLPETKAASAQVVAERIRSAVEEYPFIIQRGQLERLTVTLGIACHPPFGVTALTLVDAARKALRDGKRAGRNRVETAAAAQTPSSERS
ncbi:MAG: hypothetical protein Kow00129_11860 [Thermoleophilia bacterium]